MRAHVTLTTQYPSFRARTTGVSNPVRYPSFRALSVKRGPVARFRHRRSCQYQRISPLHWQFPQPLPPSSRPVSEALFRLSRKISLRTWPTAYAPFKPSDSEQRLHGSSYRGCWHELSPCFLQGSITRLRAFLPLDRALQPEGLHRPRGVARSGLRPLPKILDCSLP